jgi:tungstate transport system substrate-binding protein
MHNRFLLLAPAGDPARAAAAGDACAALRAIAGEQATFISRGDDSGTHKKERELWACAGTEPRGSWYLDVGQGMAETLAIAAEREGYTLSDEATYRALQPRGLVALPLADDVLRNPYSVIVVRGARNGAGAGRFAAWLTGPGREVIASFGLERFGRPLFTPDAAR